MASSATTFTIDQTTILSFLAVSILLLTAYLASHLLLHPRTPPSLRSLFIWHAFDALIHFVFEGSYLYTTFFHYAPFSSATSHPAAAVGSANFLGHGGLWSYGAKYGSGWMAALWREYARADSRWEVADAGVASLELLTVFVGGPMAVWICVMIARADPRVNIWIIVLAVAELYGGWMTFVPEWLTGSTALDTSNFMFKWVYLFFFNTLWVWIPLYAIYVAYGDICDALYVRNAYYVAKLAKEQAEKGR